ncbi:MAG: DUF3833 domain-containing protein [Sphingomonadales bacterium]|nr:MAG: DUF3833 domain-containing protein [Sphingomonadales bacterium]
MKKLLYICIAAAALSGCGSLAVEGERYSAVEPEFRIEEFFNGDVQAWGIVQDRSGNVVQRFEVAIDGSFEDGILTLDETFTYGIGEGTEHRVWTIRADEDGGYIGTADDIEGTAEGASFGNAFRWAYQMDLPVGTTTYRVRFDDWMWAFDDTTIINRSYIRKFGLTFAEVTIFMQRRDTTTG